MNSKTNFFLGLICVCLVSLSFDLSAQAPTRDPNKQPTPATTTPATTTKTDPATQAKARDTKQTGTTTQTEAMAMKGDHTSSSSCVDMNVRKGCVTYTITALEGAATAKSSAAQKMRAAHAKRVKVCANSNGTPTNICPNGASRFKIAYEKADKSTEVDFTNK